ncbi:uncharacterized protein LOC113274420 [Papaver somniferum]|uniref:uncharacterized protein LOC113274420 n=1 Tax=Papaver somniferum TaxID=3469 RepID=UPI000E6FCCCD|nr:uncharacterized protein LOC113274420 [Papaver somniferum]
MGVLRFPEEKIEDIPCLVSNEAELLEFIDKIYHYLEDPRDEIEENFHVRKLLLMGNKDLEEFLRFMNSPSNPLNYEKCTSSEEEEEELDPRTFFKALTFLE